MKKKIGIIIFVVIVLIAIAIFIGRRIYYFTVIKNVYEAIENFRNEDNSYYAVTITNNNMTKVEEILVKDNKVKWNEKKDNVDVYCEWKDFNSDEEYSIIFKNKTFDRENKLIIQSDDLTSLPKTIYRNKQIDLKKFLEVKKISSIDYNNQKCYKIITSAETVIVNKKNNLPIYYSVETRSSDEETEILTETTYEFKVGEVTDEDIALPDLTGYTQISGE